LILAPLPLWIDGSEGVIFTYAFLTGGLLLVAIAAVIVAAAAVSVWKRLSHQACGLEGLGVTEAMGRGWRILRHHLRAAGFTWLITLGLYVSWTIVMVPVVFALLGMGLLIGGLPGVAAGILTGLTAIGDTALVVGLALGATIFMLILVAPLVLIGALREVFVSSLWTLTYQNLQDLKRIALKPSPVPGPSGLETASVR